MTKYIHIYTNTVACTDYETNLALNMNRKQNKTFRLSGYLIKQVNYPRRPMCIAFGFFL